MSSQRFGPIRTRPHCRPRPRCFHPEILSEFCEPSPARSSLSVCCRMCLILFSFFFEEGGGGGAAMLRRNPERLFKDSTKAGWRAGGLRDRVSCAFPPCFIFGIHDVRLFRPLDFGIVQDLSLAALQLSRRDNWLFGESVLGCVNAIKWIPSV